MFLQVCVCPQKGCLVPGVSAPRGVSVPGGYLVLGGVHSRGIPACTEADPPGETATAADVTHPTGMHSCLAILLNFAYLLESSVFSPAGGDVVFLRGLVRQVRHASVRSGRLLGALPGGPEPTDQLRRRPRHRHTRRQRYVTNIDRFFLLSPANKVWAR